MRDVDEKRWRPKRFLPTTPFQKTWAHAKEYGCDLALPNGVGVGNLVCFTRLVEEYARRAGRPLRVLTAPLSLVVGLHPREGPYPFWEGNPFVEDIVNADEIDPEIMRAVVLEQDNYVQFSHLIENICHVHGLRPRRLRGSLFLSPDEQRRALETLAEVPRPVVCLHPGGSSSSTNGRWRDSAWNELVDALSPTAGLVQLGLADFDEKGLGIFHPDTTLREAAAILWASDLFIGFDSGLAHLATAVECTAIVLWDAVRKSRLEEYKEPGFASATMLRWSYPQNRNLLILGERDDELLQLVLREARERLGSLDR